MQRYDIFFEYRKDSRFSHKKKKHLNGCFLLVVLPEQYIINRFKHELKQNGAESAERVLMSGSDGVQAVSF